MSCLVIALLFLSVFSLTSSFPSAKIFVHLLKFIGELQELKIQDSLFVDTIPVLLVQICGMVVGVQRSSSKLTVDVDDGTGVMTCVYWSDLSLTLGDIVTVNGKMVIFEKRQIQVHSLVIEQDPMVEMLHWLKTIQLNKIYKSIEIPTIDFELDSKPLIVNDPNMELNQHLKELFKRDVRIAFDDLLVRNSVIEMVSKMPDKKLNSVISASIRKLLKEGFLFERDELVYEHVTMENVGKEIQDIVKKEGELYIDEILLLLKPSVYRDVPKHRIQRILNQLIHMNILCKNSNKYSLF
jgi:hypothetical protein